MFRDAVATGGAVDLIRALHTLRLPIIPAPAYVTTSNARSGNKH